MQNILWIIHQLTNPFFWGFVLFPVFILLAIWPVIVNRISLKNERVNRWRAF